MPSFDCAYSVEDPFFGSEKPSSFEGSTLSILHWKRQIETAYSSLNESRI